MSISDEVFGFIHANKSMQLANEEIQIMTGLSCAQVSQAIHILKDLGWVEVSGARVGSKGRAVLLYSEVNGC